MHEYAQDLTGLVEDEVCGAAAAAQQRTRSRRALCAPGGQVDKVESRIRAMYPAAAFIELVRRPVMLRSADTHVPVSCTQEPRSKSIFTQLARRPLVRAH